MTKTAFQAVVSPDQLQRAWHHIYSLASPSSRKTRGSDNQSISDFAAGRDFNLKLLRKDLLSDEGYSYSHLKAALLPKIGGGVRVICVPTVRDRIVQRALIEYLVDGDKCGVVNNVSYGFVRNRGVKDAALRVCELRAKHSWVYKADISKFFDSIPRKELKQIVASSVRQKSLHPLLLSAVDCEIDESSRTRRKAISKAGINSGKGVRQGMPLSPLFANIVLRDFDREMEKAGYKMVRYADDLVVMADGHDDCLKIHEACKFELAKLGLTIHDPGPGSKTQIYCPSEHAEFLGVGLVKTSDGYVVNLLDKQLVSAAGKILQFADFTNLFNEGITVGQLGQRIDGIASGLLGSYDYCHNVAQLEQRLNSARNSVLSGIYEKGLGLNLSRLNKAQKRFLGLK